jgi:hypothetical protein
MVAVVRAEEARVAGMEVAATEGTWVAVGMAAAAAAVVAMVAVATAVAAMVPEWLAATREAVA